MGEASQVSRVAVEQVSARTLRRHTVRIESQTQALIHRLDALLDRLGEQAERLRVIESDIEKIQRNMGVMASHSRVAHVPQLPAVNLLANI